MALPEAGIYVAGCVVAGLVLAGDASVAHVFLARLFLFYMLRLPCSGQGWDPGAQFATFMLCSLSVVFCIVCLVLLSTSSQLRR